MALAGFGSLAALIGRRPGGESGAVEAGRLRAMLERSLTAMMLAILPVALSRFDLPPNLVWGVPSVLFVLVAPYLHVAPIRRLRRSPEYQPGLAYQLSGWLALVMTLGLLFAGLFELVPLSSAFGLALVIELFVAATIFLRVASSVISVHEPPTS